MKLIYKGNGLIIRKRLLRAGMTVCDERSGRRVVAPLEFIGRCVYLFSLESKLELTAAEHAFVTSYVFERFGMACLHPTSLPAQMFLTGDPTGLLGSAVLAARGGIPGLYDEVERHLGL